MHATFVPSGSTTRRPAAGVPNSALQYGEIMGELISLRCEDGSWRRTEREASWIGVDGREYKAATRIQSRWACPWGYSRSAQDFVSLSLMRVYLENRCRTFVPLQMGKTYEENQKRPVSSLRESVSGGREHTSYQSLGEKRCVVLPGFKACVSRIPTLLSTLPPRAVPTL